MLWAATENKGIKKKNSRSIQDPKDQNVSLKLTNSFSTKL